MEFSDTKLGKAAVVTVNGRIDNLSASLFQAHCDRVVAKGEKFIIFDFEDVRFLSSAGLRVIVTVGKKVQAAGGNLIFCGLKGPVAEVFEISGFSTMFKICGNIEEAASLVL